MVLKGVDILSKYYSIHEFSKMIGVSAQTLRNWDNNGKLHPHHTTASGYRYYSEEQLGQVMRVKPDHERIIIGYCRVSSQKQKDDLERQIENVKTYLIAKGHPFEIISDIGSGINYKKKGLQDLIKRISQNEVEKVVVLYKDRLLRFGFELVEYIASLHNCKIEIIDHTEKSEHRELVEDLVQIITVFSGKLQGKRANKARKLVQELIQEEGDNGKSHKSNVDTE
jgi:predicted site-specific integrase-resolvase